MDGQQQQQKQQKHTLDSEELRAEAEGAAVHLIRLMEIPACQSELKITAAKDTERFLIENSFTKIINFHRSGNSLAAYKLFKLILCLNKIRKIKDFEIDTQSPGVVCQKLYCVLKQLTPNDQLAKIIANIFKDKILEYETKYGEGQYTSRFNIFHLYKIYLKVSKAYF